jgi:hypothetical protein
MTPRRRPPDSLLFKDVEYVFNVLRPEKIGQAGSVPHVFQQAAIPHAVVKERFYV